MGPNLKQANDRLFAQLDLALFEQLSGGLYRAAGPLPEWLQTPEEIDLAEQFPLLETFLLDCEDAWEAGLPEKMQSDIWTEADGNGGERYLQAVAASASGTRYIAIRYLPEALFTHRELAHDFELEKEKTERLSREVEVKRREAEHATKARSDFLAAMSHEVRTPLNSIIGMADVLSLTELTDDQKKYVEIFRRNGVSLLTLINDILDLSKVESGHMQLEVAELDVEEVVSGAMEVVESRASAKGLWLRKSIAPDVPRLVTGDASRLRQILLNLLGNSIKFTERGGLEVKVEVDPENPRPGNLRFSVSDTGIGIPANKLGLIFESFTQADSSTTRRYGGTGLGLSISRQLVELMHGRIWVESDVGAGSTFFFTGQFGVRGQVPERVEAVPDNAVHASIAELEARVGKLRILLVDDSEDNRILILSYLKRTQLSIVTAENGRVAVERFREGPFDVVLMDVEMPVMDGYEAVREIRRIERETDANPTPVLALTAHAFADVAAGSEEAGFTELLTKPIRHLTLLEALARYGGAPDAALSGNPAQAEEEIAPPSFLMRIEKGMEDVVPRYLSRRRADVAICREALAAGNLAAIARLAHKMKGTGTGYGFPALTDVGAAMEKAALLCDVARIREQIDFFASYVERVELEYPE